MKSCFKLSPAWFKRKAMTGIFLVLLLIAGLGVYWKLTRDVKIEMLNVGGRQNPCTCSKRLNQ
ncbi:MAG: hypothetical protein ONB48_07145 [candidate division KSB1 bacterium]|nr:hypothetical protein [candidate division KSB1 bacterium]MDZ7273316.1 hypothetical protein [candidate division KSB1 bacterium]MDZ7285420.1 hypothetical protein [candidate division KSB1 bacterium]MDZ7298451.1 hypothetical protein [candidate division KSB1 bacterium]MDZ7348916.1 hypothetical protein [candidate division KSB1 bacterium]